MSTSGIDLSELPEPLRRKLQERLDRLPAGLRAKLLASLGKVPPQMLDDLLERGSPMLDRLLDRLEQQLPAASSPETIASSPTRRSAASVSKAPVGHFNATVQRGDRQSWPLAAIVLVGGLVLLLYRLGVLGG